MVSELEDYFVLQSSDELNVYPRCKETTKHNGYTRADYGHFKRGSQGANKDP